MRTKYIGKLDRWSKNYSSKIIRTDDDYKGYISLIKIEKVIQKVIVKSDDITTCLYDNGYHCITFLPDNEYGCVEAIYDKNQNIVEWYFDMTKLNSIDENGNSFFDDLYLDIAVLANGKVIIFDEDELLEALDKKQITQADYDLAHTTADMLMKEYIPNKKFMIDFFNKYLAMIK